MKLPTVINFPQTTTILALGLLFGNLALLPMVAALGRFVPDAYSGVVENVAGVFKDGLLLVLGFYFSKVVNAGQQDMAIKAMDVAAASQAVTDEPGSRLGRQPR